MVVDVFACWCLASIYSWYAYTYSVLYISIPPTIYTLILYHYGYQYNRLVWSPNYAEATLWHCSIHVAVALTAGYGSYLVGDLS